MGENIHREPVKPEKSLPKEIADASILIVETLDPLPIDAQERALRAAATLLGLDLGWGRK